MKKEFLGTKTPYPTPPHPTPFTSTTLTTNRAVINRHQPVGTSCMAFPLLCFNFVLALILFPPSLLSFSHFTPPCSSILWGKIKKKLISPGQLADWRIQLPYYLDNIMTVFPPAAPHMPAPLWLSFFFSEKMLKSLSNPKIRRISRCSKL